MRSAHLSTPIHWPESPVKSENELVEVALQVRRTDSVVSSAQEPRVQACRQCEDQCGVITAMLVGLGLIDLGSPWHGWYVGSSVCASCRSQSHPSVRTSSCLLDVSQRQRSGSSVS